MATNNLPSKVKAVLQPSIQTTDLEITSLPLQQPLANSDEHLIQVHATAPCAGELLWAKNFADFIPAFEHHVPCFDLSGTVVSAPAGSRFKPGTEVWTRTPATRTGNLREYTIALTSELAVKPASLSWVEAAAVPLSLFTAYQGLFVHGGLGRGWKSADEKARSEGKRVLITAGAGGVGVIAVQLARASGAKDVIAICGTENVDFVKELGANEVIDYKKQSLGEWAKTHDKVDLVFDLLGRQTLKDSWTAVKDGGKLVGINEPPEKYRPTENAPDIEAKFFIMECLGEQLEDIADLVEAGKLKAIVDSVYEFEDYQKAFDKVATGHARGKAVIKVP